MTAIQASPSLQSVKTILLPYDFISVQGPDAEKFLQGQLSCDVSSLNTQSYCYGTANSPKGRMYSLFKIARWKEGFILRLHHSLRELSLENLAKYKVFFNCTLQYERTIKSYGYVDCLPEGFAAPQQPFDLHRKQDALLSRCTTQPVMFELWQEEGASTSASTDPDLLEEWFALETSNGVAELYRETADQFILQYLNLQQLNAVSFNKGCYTGQEIIARMKFLGKLKKQGFLIESNTAATALPGSKLLDAKGKKCGEVVRLHRLSSNHSVGMAVMDIALAESLPDVRLDVDNSPAFQVSPLLYQAVQKGEN